ncbi:hypothetical protein R1sor_016902 [Riccia sorocarpa]|uniref:Uncharacterized protein n=1 Tax=Riccia sorocarpa TaxID=122646 RepID=A0ABD3HGR5_9MARC
MEQLKGIEGHRLDCAADCVAFLSEKFRLHKEKLYGGINDFRRFFWEIKVGEVNRSKRYDCLPIDGTRKLHCFYGFSRLILTLLKVKEMCCFRPSCIDEDWDNCTNSEYTGPWTLHNVHPKKPADVVNYVQAMGHGEDAYGETHDAGTSVLKGIWNQQLGKSPTCFIRYDSAPESVVVARRVIHVRFALSPTGVLRNSPSLKLSNDTLEAILASLQR